MFGACRAYPGAEAMDQKGLPPWVKDQGVLRHGKKNRIVVNFIQTAKMPMPIVFSLIKWRIPWRMLSARNFSTGHSPDATRRRVLKVIGDSVITRRSSHRSI